MKAKTRCHGCHFEEGKPIDRRPTEKADNVPAFPEQTRAPFRKTAAVQGDDAHRQPRGAVEPGVSAERQHHPHRAAAGPAAHSPQRRQGVEAADRRHRLSPRLARKISACSTSCSIPTSQGTSGSSSASSATSTARTPTRASRARGSTRRRSRSPTSKVIFRALPVMPSKRLGAKTGGRIVFDKAGNLLMPLGDRSDSPPWDVAQKMDTHLGKIIRIAPDGTVPADNPFVGQPGVLPEIWAYWHAQSGRACLRSAHREAVAERSRAARRRRAEHRRERQELRMADCRARHRLSGRADRRDPQGRNGRACLLLGSGDRAVRPCVLHGQSVSAVEEQHVRRRAARRACSTGSKSRTTRSWAKSRC